MIFRRLRGWLSRLLVRRASWEAIGVDLGEPGGDRAAILVVDAGRRPPRVVEAFEMPKRTTPTMHAARRSDLMGAMAFGPLCGARDWELLSVEADRVTCADCRLARWANGARRVIRHR